MIKRLKAILFAILCLPFAAAAQNDTLQAGVAISIGADQEIWTGQQVTLNLDLKTSGLSFSNSHFNLPEVRGAFLMQTDTTTVKLTENIDGQNWQIVRYPLALYPQKPGQLEIPPISVRFSTSAGFGSAEQSFEFQTEALSLHVKLPPGVTEGDLVITTSSFEIDHDWHPTSGTAHTGDAFTLTVHRRASDISAMLLPPLPVFRVKGLAAYPQAPVVNDKSNRGDLSGERTDSIIWVVEEPGEYEIPGIRFQWWDPSSRELKQQVVAGISLDILPSRSDRISDGSGLDTGNNSSRLWLMMIIALLALVAISVWLRFHREKSGEQIITEKSAFGDLQKACANNQAGHAYAAIHTWLAFSLPENTRPETLAEFAGTCDDRRLATELNTLQEALAFSIGDWQGKELRHLLKRTRRKIKAQSRQQSSNALLPLNP